MSNVATQTNVRLLKGGTRKLKKWRAHHGVVADTRARRRSLAVLNYNQRAIATCPGRTPWCEARCYANRAFFLLKGDLYDRAAEASHTTDGLVDEVRALPFGAWVRIHGSGDFDTAGYVDRWIAAAGARPDVRFWGYTRSWREQAEARSPGIVDALERLRELPNVEIFASTDPDTEDPPDGWRVAWVDADPRAHGLVCPEQTGRHPDCAACGFCILGQFGDVVFREH